MILPATDCSSRASPGRVGEGTRPHVEVTKGTFSRACDRAKVFPWPLLPRRREFSARSAKCPRTGASANATALFARGRSKCGSAWTGFTTAKRAARLAITSPWKRFSGLPKSDKSLPASRRQPPPSDHYCFPVLPENAAHSIGDLSNRCIRFHRRNDPWHEVGIGSRGFFDLLERRLP